MQTIIWADYSVVGFTSTFEQNIASLALAKQIKANYPKITTVFGGANWEDEMGVELHNSFGFVDYVCSGEADESFPELLRRLRDRGPIDEPDSPIKGVMLRSQGRSVFTGPAAPIRHMDGQPIPDFSEYFDAINRSSAARVVFPRLLCETSRGCWWGAKSHCTFCGLNGGTMEFRSKSAPRALAEITYLTQQWRNDFVEVVDNILDMKYFDTLLADLAERQLGVHFFYEVKANLSRRHVERLAAAGVFRIQPGIESMSNRILKLMRKGTTALRNIQLLKWCKEYRIDVDWNLLYGFPGETREDYRETLRLLKAIRFLGPPCGCGPLRLDRFSPYHNDPSSFGMIDVRPLAAYRYLYPFEEERLCRIAYYFDFAYSPELDATGCADEVIAFVDAWRGNPELGGLWSVARRDGTLALIDTRLDAQCSEFRLDRPQKVIYEFCDEIRPVSMIYKFLTQACPELQFDEAGLITFLDSLVDNRLMVTDGLYYLGLAIPVRPVLNDVSPTLQDDPR
jgi:ribosomal peptide maturation radical SAM protein 1